MSDDQGVRLQKVLAAAGIASRRAASSRNTPPACSSGYGSTAITNAMNAA